MSSSLIIVLEHNPSCICVLVCASGSKWTVAHLVLLIYDCFPVMDMPNPVGYDLKNTKQERKIFIFVWRTFRNSFLIIKWLCNCNWHQFISTPKTVPVDMDWVLMQNQLFLHAGSWFLFWTFSWAAASGQVSLNAMILPAALYFWQIPHFMALAYLCRNDYAAGGYECSLIWSPDVWK